MAAKRPVIRHKDYAEVILTKGQVAIIDIEDADFIGQWNWCAYWCVDRYYAKRGSTGKTVKMHRIIAKAPKNMHVDHIDGDPLNNRKENLRLVSQAENNRNNKMRGCNTSGYKGVCWHKATQKYIARIGVNGKKVHLGVFDDAKVAYRAYCQASEKYHGKYGRVK